MSTSWANDGQNPNRQKWTYPGTGADEAAKRKIEAIYGSDIGGEYKERLSCEVEGREFTGYTPPPAVKRRDTSTPSSTSMAPGRTASPAKSQKQQNEEFFARRGEANAGRPEGVRPSEGGKYAGFGSSFTPEPQRQGAQQAGGGAPPALNEFQQDPLGALGKGLGWFGGVVGKAGKSVNEGWIQPTAQKIAEAELATQARQAAGTAGKTIQTGAKGAADRFNNFIENEGVGGATGAGGSGSGSGGSAARGGVKPERQDFWDSFGDAGKAGGGGGGGGGGGSIGTSAVKKGGKDEGGWGNDW
ncbi:MAG: Zn finger-containing GTPase- Activating Protein for ARF [Ramalina farinacea]|uniref:Zn finger-containing GTPase- Activating Protein for ARF n=1 Tax=Ramalina farinacea TaxID=258253 RepID=A0AA43TY76_9LECA|nr:Zn finger-containing GTPase- Activating Protein for ARF [Ramalina farinacea]